MHIQTRLGVLIDQRSTNVHFLFLRDIGDSDGDVAGIVAAEVVHTAAVGFHTFGRIEYHLGFILDLAFTSTDGNHGAVGIFLESYDVCEVTRNFATCVVAHTSRRG